ncbi:transglycosylase SLT domain-containing protein [Amycolatopsis thermalba]|uniref:Transglycosylase SLT domain-containing protein n=1 Tax=Amycolatopsis thermalba TaxID=944492 RepID=A0ABY4NYT9_9PSEU|nr:MULTISPECIES: transglycosylase SLT domain-containing protein [Amycolatopsis]UQS25212.1 transglycosylase SLT domain-containing protein [Amycolatopsis thermalba]
MGSHNFNNRAPRKAALFSPDRYRPRHAAKPKNLGRIGARTSVSASLLMMSVAGSASPLAMASGSGEAAPPAPAAGATPVAGTVAAVPVLGPPSTWVVTTPAPVLDIPAAIEVAAPEPVAVETPVAEPAPAPPPAPEVFDTTGDPIAGWINEAIRVMRAQGVPVDGGDVQAIRTIIDKESSGNPNAVNRWDSNWRAGHPSKGLMQCIDSTFNAHKLPGHDDIFNPVDNIIAGVRYTISRYGGFDGHPGLKSIRKGSGYRGY